MPMRNAYFALSVHDSALFYTFLSHYAASYHSHYRTGHTLESIFYRTKAIELVNERLKTQELDEGTVAAVANMAIYDVSLCCFSCPLFSDSGEIIGGKIELIRRSCTVVKWRKREHESPSTRLKKNGRTSWWVARRRIFASCSTTHRMVRFPRLIYSAVSSTPKFFRKQTKTYVPGLISIRLTFSLKNLTFHHSLSTSRNPWKSLHQLLHPLSTSS
jgi:hypothetical protein